MADPQQNDPWAARAQQLGVGPSASPSAPKQQPPDDDPWVIRSKQLESKSAPAAEPSADPWAQRAAQITPTPGAQPVSGTPGDDPARMGVGQSVFTRPLSTYLGIPEYRKGAGGVERAAEKFASSLTSPLNLGLMLVTAGVGGVAEAGAATAASEAGEALAPEALSLAGKAGASILSKLTPETAAKVATASGAIEKLTNLGFTLTQLHDVATSVPSIGEAIKAGDFDKAAELTTTTALGSVLAGLSAAHMVRGKKVPGIKQEQEIVAAEQGPLKYHEAVAGEFEHKNAEQIKDHPTDMAGLIYKEAGGREGLPTAGATSPPAPGESPSAEGPKPKPEPERRVDAERRKKIAEMSPAEMKRELLTSKVTDLPNRRAFDEALPAKVHGMSDADGLKALNDKLGYAAGDAMLRAKADALREAGIDAYHDKGDEFLFRAEDPVELGKRLEEAKRFLRDTEIKATLPDGTVKYFKGADFSYGTGSTLEEAEAGLKENKSSREASGLRARGELRGITEVTKGDEGGVPKETPPASQATPEVKAGQGGTPPPDQPVVAGAAGDGEAGTIARLKAWRAEIAQDKNLTPQMRERWLGFIDRAMNLPENVKDLSSQLTGEYTKYWQMYKDKGIVREALPDGSSNEGRVNYAGPHIYDSTDPTTSSLVNRQRLSKNPQHLKPRQFATAVEALHNGFEPTRGLAGAHAEYIRQFGAKMSHYGAEQALLNTRASDGLPLALSPTMVRPVKEVIHAPDGIGDYGHGLMPGKTRTATRLESLGLSDISKIPQDKIFQGQDGHLYLDVSEYRPGPELFTRKRWKANVRNEDNVAEGRAITEAKPLLVHPDHLDEVKSMYDDSSWFRKNPIMRAALTTSTLGKKSLLSLSPFHWTTEYLRGIQMGLNPWEALNPPRITPESYVVRAKYGANVLKNSQAHLEYSEGVATNNSMLSKIPGIGKILGQVEEKLFGNNGYIDRLKGAAFDKVAKQLKERNRNWSTDQVEMASSKIVDAAFGGLNYKMMGVTMSSQDALRLFFLAPDFTGSQIAFAKYGVQPGGSVVAQSLGRIALYNFGVAQLLNLMVTGKVHPEHPFGVLSPDEKRVWTVRTMPQDMMHAMTDPRGFIYNRLNPVITRTGAETLTGRDQEGKTVTPERQLHDLLRNVLPISLQAGLPGYHPEGQTWGTQALRAAGATALPNRSVAEETARKAAFEHNPGGAIKPEQAKRHQLVLDLENKLHNKEITPEEISKQVEAGNISKKDVGEIKTNLRETMLMGEADARLYRYAMRLPADELLKVWDVATPDQKKDIRPLLIKRYVAYIKEGVPADPTYQRLVAIFGKPEGPKE